MRGVFECQYLVDDVLKGSKVSFRGCPRFWSWAWYGMMIIPCDRCSTSDASGSFFTTGAILCRPRQECGWDLVKTSFLNVFDIFNVDLSWRAMFWEHMWNFNVCSRNPLRTLCMSDRSCNPLGAFYVSDCPVVARLLILAASRNPSCKSFMVQS